MQEGIGWDPLYVHVERPWYVKVYVIYLFVVFCVCLARSIRLAAQVWSFRGRKTVPVSDVHAPSDVKVLASSLLKCAITLESL